MRAKGLAAQHVIRSGNGMDRPTITPPLRLTWHLPSFHFHVVSLLLTSCLHLTPTSSYNGEPTVVSEEALGAVTLSGGPIVMAACAALRVLADVQAAAEHTSLQAHRQVLQALHQARPRPRDQARL